MPSFHAWSQLLTRVELRRYFLRIVTGTLRLAAGPLGFLVRPMVRWVARHELIACGFRTRSGEVRIIYSPMDGHRRYVVVCRTERAWSQRPSVELTDFAPSLVRQIGVPSTRIGEEYRLFGLSGISNTLQSPSIAIKEATRWSKNLLRIEPRNGGAVCISWDRVDTWSSMLYFLVVQEAGGSPLCGVYTRELSWCYPHVQKALLSIGKSSPPPLAAGAAYEATLVVVDFEGWVPLVASANFFGPK